MDKLNLELERNTLKELFQKVLSYLKSNCYKDILLFDQPCYLIIGSANSGKTNFITQGKINLIGEQLFATNPHDESIEKKRCNWWCSEQGTLIDVPGNYFTLENKDGISWSDFLELGSKFFRTKRLSGVVVTMSFVEWSLLSKTQQQEYTQQLRQKLLLLTKQHKIRCPVYWVFTHLDQVAGFCEFFADLGFEEQQQPCGFNLFATGKDITLPSVFKKRFEQFLKRLHERIIWRSQQERLLGKQGLIQHFPWQLECQKENLSHLFYHLGDILGLTSHTPLQGIYFVSSLQQGQTADLIPKVPQGELQFNHSALILNSKKRTAYFSQDLWKKVIFNHTADAENIFSRSETKSGTFSYLFAAGVVLTSSLFMAYSFNSKVNHLNAAQSALGNYHILAKQLPITNPNMNQVLPALNSLETSIRLLQQANLPWLIQDFHRHDTLNSIALKDYHQILVQYFLPSLSTLLEPILANTNDPTLVYGALNIYLMLGNPNHLDKVTVINWFASYWKTTLTNNLELQNQLMRHLETLLSKPIPPLILKQALINKARFSLASVPEAQLAYSILRNENNNGGIQPLLTSSNDLLFKKVFLASSQKIAIPNLYTQQYFQTIFFNLIPKVSLDVIHGNWVTGPLNHPEPGLNSQAELIQKVRIQYLQDYARYWQNLLTNLTLQDWQDWQSAKEGLTLLTNPPKSLNKILQVIIKNTAEKNLLRKDLNSNDRSLIQTNLTNQFHLTTDLPKDVHDASKHLLSYLTDIMQSRDSNKAAYLSAKARFTQTKDQSPIDETIALANKYPEPFQDWLNTMSLNVWKLVLEHTDQHLNQMWQNDVANFYHRQLENRYPLQKNSREDINLKDFVKFFGPGGNIDAYLNNYLSVFIDNSSPQWRYRTLNGQSVNLGNDFLSQLERSTLIRSMFFNNETQLTVTFSIQPQAFEPGVQSIKISLNGQSIEDTKDELTTPHFFTWPGSAKDQIVKITFLNDQGVKTSKIETGPWALFRLLDQANLQQLTDTKDFQLTFDLNGNSARYQLLAANAVNPFIPGIVEGFHCP